MPARKIVQIAATTEGEVAVDFGAVLFALADDGSVWRLDQPGFEDTPAQWMRVPSLPEPPRCSSNVDRDGDNYWCHLAQGHAGMHRNDGREWTNLEGR